MAAQHGEMREDTARPPSGLWGKLRWYGPGILWMISSVGSGTVLFTPRVGARYGYELLWAAAFVIASMWIMIHEVGRYTVVSGRSILHGFRELPGPRGWAVWLISVPQAVAGVVTVAGLAALAGSALMLALPGGHVLYAMAILGLSSALVLTGSYKWVERATLTIAVVLGLAAVITAFRVFPDPGELAAGLVPRIPEDADPGFILPWIGYILAGAAGLLWFSYWVGARTFGGEFDETGQAPHGKTPQKQDDEHREEVGHLHDWLRLMGGTAAIGVIGGGIAALAFLVLGTELLRPEGIIPEGVDVAEELSHLLADVWGRFGFWLMVIGLAAALWGSILADQDGWGRMFADSTLLVLPERWCPSEAHDESPGDETSSPEEPDGPGPLGRWKAYLCDRAFLKNFYILTLATGLPLAVLAFANEPVGLLSIGGIIAAVHMPFVVFLTLYVNRTQLPEPLRPGWAFSTLMTLSGLFFLVVAVVYLLDLAGISIA